ncbi:AAA family ATPase [Alistipes sp.]|uniref:AAA family ATPase n=1 Tax=Alistipes sp. TaxID=1872444 RepID=UPI003AB1D5B9
MGQTLTEIAQALKDANKKVQLIYAFNGTGKTRLSREFKESVAPKSNGAENQDESRIKILYYNAFTEDLFYWNNAESNRKLKIQPNNFTKWVLEDQGQENNIVTHFQHYTSEKLNPRFNEEYIIKDKDNGDITISAYSEITFSIARGNDQSIDNIKISKGEESCLIWCVFYSLLEQVVEVLNIAELNERDTDKFNDLEYVFIDDPVSSLDDNHLIELAVNLAELIKSSHSELKFIITTHNPLFYNVLFNEFNGEKRILKSRFDKLEDGTYILEETKDSPFSYHLLLLSELEKAIESNNMQKYHFNFLRNILEKTSTFLGYDSWRELLPEESREAYCNRIINLYSHSKHSGEEIAIVRDDDKRMLSFLVREIKRVHGFK